MRGLVLIASLLVAGVAFASSTSKSLSPTPSLFSSITSNNTSNVPTTSSIYTSYTPSPQPKSRTDTAEVTTVPSIANADAENEDEADYSPASEQQPQKGDTAIVQNNYNVKMSSRQFSKEGIFWTVVGSLLIILLVMGLIILGIIMGRLLEKDEKKPMIVMPPPGANIKWTHDPIYEIPQGYKTKDVNTQDGHEFSENELYPSKYD